MREVRVACSRMRSRSCADVGGHRRLREEVGVGDDRRERVVELVGDARERLADERHLLGLQQAPRAPRSSSVTSVIVTRVPSRAPPSTTPIAATAKRSGRGRPGSASDACVRRTVPAGTRGERRPAGISPRAKGPLGRQAQGARASRGRRGCGARPPPSRPDEEDALPHLAEQEGGAARLLVAATARGGAARRRSRARAPPGRRCGRQPTVSRRVSPRNRTPATWSDAWTGTAMFVWSRSARPARRGRRARASPAARGPGSSPPRAGRPGAGSCASRRGGRRGIPPPPRPPRSRSRPRGRRRASSSGSACAGGARGRPRARRWSPRSRTTP